MEAYRVAIPKCVPGEAIISGEKTISVGEFLEILTSMAKVEIKREVDESLLRPSDVTLQIPNCEKFKSATGWKPQYSFEDSIQHLLKYWRARVYSQTDEQ